MFLFAIFTNKYNNNRLILHRTKFQQSMLNEANVTPTSEVRTAALFTARTWNIPRCRDQEWHYIHTPSHETQSNGISCIDPRAAMVPWATCHPLGATFFHLVWIYELMQYQISVLDARSSVGQSRRHFECGWPAVINLIHQRYVWQSVESVVHNGGANTTQLRVARIIDILLQALKYC